MPSSKQPEVVTPPKKRLLVVDDDPDFTSLIKLNLEETGEFEVREENRSEHALDTAREFKPDLIFLDIMMPNVMGGKVSSQVEADEELKDTPVVFLTAVVPEETRREKTRIGGRPFITKPVSPEEVLAVVEKYILKKVLLIADKKRLSTVLRFDINETTEFRAKLATSGEAGIELIKTYRPDLVLLDVMLPETNGLAILRQIKETDPGLPVTMVASAWEEEEEVKRCLDAGAHECITEPIDVEYLKTAMVTWRV